MKKDILMTEERKVKVGRAWVTVDTSSEYVDKEQHRKATCRRTLDFFRSFGGTEKVSKGDTAAGLTTWRVVSTNPTKTRRTIRTYDFNRYKNGAKGV